MKRLTVMLIVFVVVWALLIAGIWTLIVPTFQAQAEIRIGPIIPRLVFRTDENGMIPLYDSFVNTQVSIIRSPTVLDRVLDWAEIQKTEWYRNPPKSFVQRVLGNPPPPNSERLRDGLSVRPRARTEIVDVTFTDPSAQDARKIVDAVLDQYIRYSGDLSSEDEKALDMELQDQYRVLEREIKGREAIIARLHSLLGTELPQELVSSRRLRLEESQARLSDLQSQIAILEWEMKQTAATQEGGAPAVAGNDLPRQPKYHEDAEWRQRDIAVRTIRHNVAAGPLDPDDPDTIHARKDLEFAEELLRLRETQLDETWRDRHLPPDEAAKYELARAKREQELLRAEVEKQEAEFKVIFENGQLLDKENDGLRHKRELFEAIRARLDQKNMERNVPGSIRVLTAAYVSPKDL